MLNIENLYLCVYITDVINSDQTVRADFTSSQSEPRLYTEQIPSEESPFL